MEFIEVKRLEDCGAVVVTVAREEMRNALNQEVLKELDRVFDEVAGMEEVRSVILTGAGQKSFVAGADIGYMKNMSKEQAKAFSDYGSKVFRKIETAQVPVIAAVNGYALGGGMELALACDFRVASENAVFGLPELGLGIIPGFGGTQRLMRCIAVGKAKEMIYTGERIDAVKAMELGLVNSVVPIDGLMEHAARIAKRIAKNAPLAVAAAKKAMNWGIDEGIEDGLEIETTLFPETFGSEDQVNRMEAFVNKSKNKKD